MSGPNNVEIPPAVAGRGDGKVVQQRDANGTTASVDTSNGAAKGRTPAGVPAYFDQLQHLPTDWRLTPIGSNKAPVDWDGSRASTGWMERNCHTVDEFIEKAAEWNWWPPAVGVLLGEVSNLLQIDLDEPGANGERAASFLRETGHSLEDLPETITVTSGREGRRSYLCSVPDQTWWHALRKRVPFKDGDVTLWEIRGNRHMAVILGAHPDTGGYSWWPGCSPEEVDLADAPDWILETLAHREDPAAVHHTVSSDGTIAEFRRPTADDAAYAVEALEFIPSEEFQSYDDWLKVGMALFSADPGLLDAWIAWSRPMRTFDEGECRAKWKNFGSPTPYKGRPITVGSLFFWAREHGYEGRPKGPAIEEVQAAIAAITRKDGIPDAEASQRAYTLSALYLECTRREEVLGALQDAMEGVGIGRRASASCITKARKEWQAERATASSLRRREKAAALQKQGPTTRGVQAILDAAGDGWQYDEKTGAASRSELAPGDLLSAMSDALGKRLGFNEMNLMPTIDLIPISDGAMTTIYTKFSRNGWHIQKVAAIDAIRAACLDNPYNPVTDYLLRVEADETIEPLDLAEFYGYFHVTDPLQQRFLRLILLGAASRGLEPGCPMKVCVIMRSDEQTLFKSLALERLCGTEWFCNTRQTGEKDKLLANHAAWICELAEIDEQFDRRHPGELKALVSPSTDMIRPPYGASMGIYPRSGINVGTTNKKDFLVDRSGNHRFPVVEITRQIDIDSIEKNRDRIWKAAVALCRAGEKPWLTNEEQQASEERNEEFFAENYYLEKLARWISGGKFDLPSGVQEYRAAPPRFTTAEALERSTCVTPQTLNRRAITKGAEALEMLGYDQAKQQRINGVRVRYWYRVTGSAPAAAIKANGDEAFPE
jgi:hypothetical protein